MAIRLKDRVHRRHLLLLGIGFWDPVRRFWSPRESIKVPVLAGTITPQSVTKSRKPKSLTLTKERFFFLNFRAKEDSKTHQGPSTQVNKETWRSEVNFYVT